MISSTSMGITRNTNTLSGGREAIRIAIVGLAAAAVWFQILEPYPEISVIGVLGLAIGGWPIVKEAFEISLNAA